MSVTVSKGQVFIEDDAGIAMFRTEAMDCFRVVEESPDTYAVLVDMGIHSFAITSGVDLDEAKQVGKGSSRC